MTNLNRLYLYNLLVSLSLAVAADFVFIDLWMLRLKIGVAAIGFMKSLIFFLPVVSYQLCAPLLDRLRIDVKLCAWCYLFRALLPAVLPLAALAGAPQGVTHALCLVLLPLAMVLATFANSSLMMIYHRQLPPETFNRCSGNIGMLFSLPGTLLGIPLALALEHFTTGGDRRFFAAYAVFLLAGGALQIPAFFTLVGLREKSSGGPDRAVPGFAEQLKPYFDPRYRGILVETVLQGMLNGCGLAYVAVFCIKTVGLSFSHVCIVRTTAAIVALALLPAAGRLADRIGYKLMFQYTALLVGAGMLLFLVCPNMWTLPVFALLCWDGVLSLPGNAMYLCEQAGASRFAADKNLAGYIAGFNVSRGLGQFLGALASGALFGLLTKHFGLDEIAAFRWIFALWFPLLGLIVVTARRMIRE